MRRILRTLPLILGLALAVTVVALATDSASPPADTSVNNAATQAFERLKELEGEWRGTNSKGDAVTLSYELVSGGTAVLERERIADHPEMLTLFHVDGERVVLTHYCVGNQPRMAAEPDGSSDGRIEFELIDAERVYGGAARPAASR